MLKKYNPVGYKKEDHFSYRSGGYLDRLELSF